MRAPLAAWLEEQARAASAVYGRYRVLDVGCGAKPYYPFFAPYTDMYIGIDLAEDTSADLIGRAESIPADNGSFEVVLCTQVLEHSVDPARVIRELRRVVAPGGRVLVSTHGVQVYHPSPYDLWRWTHEGLDRLFRQQADWSSVTVRPGSGTAACVGMVVATYLEYLFKRVHVRVASRPLVATLNGSARLLDCLSRDLRELRPGCLHANYHVLAERGP